MTAEQLVKELASTCTHEENKKHLKDADECFKFNSENQLKIAQACALMSAKTSIESSP